MSTPGELLLDGYGRLPDIVSEAVDGLSAEQLARRLDPEANSLTWLVWHLSRVQDVSIAGAFDGEQVWTSQAWNERFGLPFDASDIGYGHTADQVAAVRVDDAALLTGYYAAVHARTLEQLGYVTGDDLDRVLDRSYEPAVTLGVRLMSVLQDVLQHAGQAAFLSGVLQRTAA